MTGDASDRSGDDTAARRAAREQWSRNPAGTTYIDLEPGSAAFYAEMSRVRYELQPWHLPLLRRFAPEGPLLEIGSGAGTDHAQLAALAGETIAIDLAHRGAWLTQQRLRQEGRTGSALVADGEFLPFPSSTFASVYSFGVIHHTDHPEHVVAEMRRVLRPGGRFLVALYHRESAFTAQKLKGWILHGLPRRQAWASYLAEIEAGAAALEERPRVLLYSRRMAQRLFAGFDDVRVEVDHFGVESPRLVRLLGVERMNRRPTIITGRSRSSRRGRRARTTRTAPATGLRLLSAVAARVAPAGLGRWRS